MEHRRAQHVSLSYDGINHITHTLKHCMHLLLQGQPSLGFIQVNSK